MQELQADYLVVGAGAMGMAFADVLLTETDASLVIVDRYHQPGGHWTLAYPFVRLHQPSDYYGVSSRRLGSNRRDEVGWNRGLYELATQGEITAYFDAVMQQQFLPSGRVQYFPMCEYDGNGEFHSILGDDAYRVSAGTIVDSTYMNVVVPELRPPPYEVAPEVRCVTPNALPRLANDYRDYTIVGAGKTGMDACLFLLKNGVAPERIRWVMPRDPWLFNRGMLQSGELFRESLGRGMAAQAAALARATSLDDALERVAASGFILRFDPEIWPTMWRCATVSEQELDQLRRIEDIIRAGHVRSIDGDSLILDEDEFANSFDTLHVDCTADGLAPRPAVPVFTDGGITLQSVRSCQQVFSAALIGHVEAAYDDVEEKNRLCRPVVHPTSNLDYLRTALADFENAQLRSADAGLSAWLFDCRLDGFNNPRLLEGTDDPQRQRELSRFIDDSLAAIDNLRRIIAAEEEQP